MPRIVIVYGCDKCPSLGWSVSNEDKQLWAAAAAATAADNDDHANADVDSEWYICR